MTELQLQKIKEACKPTPAMWGSNGMPLFGTPQDNANRAWEDLGVELGFDPYTVQVCGKSDHIFTAEETEHENEMSK